MARKLSPIVAIPARLAATRLPDKPLAEIAGEPMIVHVWRRAVEADVGPVVVACADARVADAVRAAGGRAELTDADLPSGSDRVHQAVERLDPDGRYDAVVNLQGDLPTIRPDLIRAALDALEPSAVDIATLACPIADPAERSDPNVVKIATAFAATAPSPAAPASSSSGPGADPAPADASAGGTSTARALYFSRTPVPWDGGDASQPLYHHIGLYAFRRAALRRFVELPYGPLERRERLEQLRALEAGMRIDVARVDTVPLGVDTPADLTRARAILGGSPV